MRQCQKCQKSLKHSLGTFGTLSARVFVEIHAVLREHRDACPGVVPVLVCHHEVVVKFEAERAADTLY